MIRRNVMGGTIPPLGKGRRLAGKSTKASRAEADALIAAAADRRCPTEPIQMDFNFNVDLEELA